jgi:formylmethanofuran dehydrogenase subunit B
MKKLALDSVVCAGCTCLCDDIRLTIEGRRIIETENACGLGETWLRRRPAKFGCAVDGEPVDFESAIEETVNLLRESRSPLVCGLDGLSTQSQIVAVEMARQIRATIDTTFTNRHRSGTLTMQSVGKVTATLGEVASRADVVLFWFCDPATTHPRFFERFCKSAKQTVLIDNSTSETAELVSKFVQIERADVYGLLSELRMQLNDSYARPLSESAEAIVDVLSEADYAVSIYGALDDNSEQAPNLQALFQLTRQLNQQMRAVAIGLRNDANAQSAENVLAWNSGFPFGVSFGRGDAQYHGLEFSAQSLLERGECDLAMICSTNSLTDLSSAAADFLKQSRTIVIADTAQEFSFTPAVRFDVGFEKGDWCRLNDVMLPVSPLGVNDVNLTAGGVLQAVLEVLPGVGGPISKTP